MWQRMLLHTQKLQKNEQTKVTFQNFVSQTIQHHFFRCQYYGRMLVIFQLHPLFCVIQDALLYLHKNLYNVLKHQTFIPEIPMLFWEDYHHILGDHILHGNGYFNVSCMPALCFAMSGTFKTIVEIPIRDFFGTFVSE